MINKLINIDLLEQNKREFVLKDKLGINLGKVFILDFNENFKNVMLRLKFYKKSEEYYETIAEIINEIIDIFLVKKEFFKINLIVDEDFDFSSIIEKGFKLEGILKDNIFKGVNHQKSEFLFGLTLDEFRKSNIKNKFAIKGKKIEIRILTPEYSKEVLDYCIRNKNHLKPYEPARESNYFSLEGQKNNLIQSYKAYLNGNEVNFGIFKNGRLIGKIRLTNIILGVLRSCTIGYSMDEKEQGNGYMKEAVQLALNYVFNVLELHRVEASTLLDNEKSQRVLTYCGFKKLGISEKYLYINGEWRDHIIFYKTYNWRENI